MERKKIHSLPLLQKKKVIRPFVVIAGERPYSCPQCNKAFKCKSNLQRHIKMHEGKKVWSCGDCANKGIEYRTFQRSNMKVKWEGVGNKGGQGGSKGWKGGSKGWKGGSKGGRQRGGDA